MLTKTVAFVAAFALGVALTLMVVLTLQHPQAPADRSPSQAQLVAAFNDGWNTALGGNACQSIGMAHCGTVGK